jgi:hypothetical protein
MLIRPHWVIARADDNDKIGNKSIESTSIDLDIGSNKSTIKDNINAFPQKNYIDLRIQQNKSFANERFRQYSELYSGWKGDIRAGVIDKNKQWELIKSCVKEGLAAYPEHAGLLDAQQLINERSCSVEIELPVGEKHVQSTHDVITQRTLGTIQLTTNGLQLAKGAERRAHAAMKDALLERTFLEDGLTNTCAAGGYSLLPEEDERPNSTQRRDASSESSNSSDESHRRKDKKHKHSKHLRRSKTYGSSSDESYRRRRKERKVKKDKHKKKRRKYKHEKKRSHKSQRRSRSSSVSKTR